MEMDGRPPDLSFELTPGMPRAVAVENGLPRGSMF